MAVTYNTVRELALRFPNVKEGLAYGTPSLHVGRKLMTRLQEDGQTLVSKIEPSKREAYFELAPDTFFLTDHYKGGPLILVDLTTVRLEVLTELIEKAWRFVASVKQIEAYDLS
jgi:hypothetical protein